MSVHQFKLAEEQLRPIWDGAKTSVLWRDDRAWEPGDVVIFREWTQEKRQGDRWGPHFVVLEITHVEQSETQDLLAVGAVCLSFRVQEKGIGAPRTLPAGIGLVGT